MFSEVGSKKRIDVAPDVEAHGNSGGASNQSGYHGMVRMVDEIRLNQEKLCSDSLLTIVINKKYRGGAMLKRWLKIALC